MSADGSADVIRGENAKQKDKTLAYLRD